MPFSMPPKGLTTLLAESKVLIMDENVERIKSAVTAHQPEDGYLQWYVDEFCIDCDAEELWRVVGNTLSENHG